jgi:hypothetical protein
MRSLLALALVAACSLAPAAARAEPPREASPADPGVAAGRTEGGTKYVFKDDLVTGGAPDASGLRIRVVPGATRRALTRPRTDFVPELLTSVENL